MTCLREIPKTERHLLLQQSYASFSLGPSTCSNACRGNFGCSRVSQSNQTERSNALFVDADVCSSIQCSHNPPSPLHISRQISLSCISGAGKHAQPASFRQAHPKYAILATTSRSTLQRPSFTHPETSIALQVPLPPAIYHTLPVALSHAPWPDPAPLLAYSAYRSAKSQAA